MRRYLIIPGALLVSILFSAKSCDEDPEANRYREEKTLLEVMDSVKDEFGSEYLDETSLFVFTKKAMQKLRDYSDYMNIASDTSIDSVYRSQALKMAEELFYPGIDPVEPFSDMPILLDSIWVTQPLHMAGTEFYKGKLGFREVVSARYTKEVEILAVKQTKIIGPDTLKVWQVFLGNMLQNPIDTKRFD